MPPSPPVSAVLPGRSPAPAVLEINGRRYAIASLPPETRALFEQIRRADELLSFKNEARQLLAWGQAALLQDLRRRLQPIQPLPAEDPSGSQPGEPAGGTV